MVRSRTGSWGTRGLLLLAAAQDASLQLAFSLQLHFRASLQVAGQPVVQELHGLPFSLPLKGPPRRTSCSCTLAGMLRPRQGGATAAGGTQGLEEQLERKLRLGRQKLKDMGAGGRVPAEHRVKFTKPEFVGLLPLGSIYTPSVRGVDVEDSLSFLTHLVVKSPSPWFLLCFPQKSPSAHKRL